MNSKCNYPLALSSWDEKEYQVMQKVIDEGMFTMGKYVQEYEQKFAEFFGTQYCVMVNSGSSANLLGIASLFFRKERPLRKGDEVIVPSVSWSTTYYPLYQLGLKLKFVDIDKDTLNLSLSALKEAISDKTRLIFGVNLLGNCIDYNEVQSIIGDRDIEVVEDNCESMGATLNGKQAGTFGSFGTFSSFFSHHISTMEGGCIVTNDEELYHIMLSMRAHGWTRNLPKHNLVTGSKSDNWFEESWNFVLPGFNLRPLELSGAIGLEQIKKLSSFVEIRRENAAYFIKKIQEIDFIRVQKEVGESSWFGFALILKDTATIERSQLVDLLSENGIECRPIVAGNFTKNEVLKYFDYEIHGNLTNADEVDQKGLFVGNHHLPMKKEIDWLIECLKKIN